MAISDKYYKDYMATNNPYVDSDYTRRVMEEVYKLTNAPTSKWSWNDIEVKPIPVLEERWVWVTGYKGMDKDMKCMNDFQYEIGKTYDMPEDTAVECCHSGFHMCLNLDEVFKYKNTGSGNRFFEVSALVRESDMNKYGKREYFERRDKLAAKSITILRELSVDEILAHIPEAAEWTDEIKAIALEKSVDEAKTEAKIHKLTTIGYSPELARYICEHADKSGYDLALALDTQPGISMDTKVMAIFSHI